MCSNFILLYRFLFHYSHAVQDGFWRPRFFNLCNFSIIYWAELNSLKSDKSLLVSFPDPDPNVCPSSGDNAQCSPGWNLLNGFLFLEPPVVLFFYLRLLGGFLLLLSRRDNYLKLLHLKGKYVANLHFLPGSTELVSASFFVMAKK